MSGFIVVLRLIGLLVALVYGVMLVAIVAKGSPPAGLVIWGLMGIAIGMWSMFRKWGK